MEQELVILSWPDYINPLTLEQFQATFGTNIILEIIPSAVEIMERMRAAGPPPDVLIPPDYAVHELNAERRLLPLDFARLPNLEHIDSRFRYGKHNPMGRMSVVKDWGTTGFMYRMDIIKERPRSWAEFWLLAERYSGRVTVLDASDEVIGAALKMRRRSFNAIDPLTLADARTDLLRLKPHLHSFETNYRPLMMTGEVCLALGWNGDAAQLKAAGVPIEYVVPIEGAHLWQDDWAIAAAARHPNAAYAFLDFVLRPEIAAQEARYTRYATANRTALALLEEHIRHDPSTYPPDEILRRSEVGTRVPEKGHARREALWKEIRG